MAQWSYYPTGKDNLVSDDFLPLLANLSTDELQELMDNEDRINEIVCDQEKVRKIKLDIELLQAENRSLADHTIEKEPVLEQLRQSLSKKYEVISQINEIFETNNAKRNSLQKRVNLEAMLNVLQAKCAMSEEKSEELAQQFYNGDLSVNEFIEEFKIRKTEAHLRRIKSDKMRELVIQARRQESVPAPSSLPNPPNPYNGTPPYPLSQQTSYPAPTFSMPMNMTRNQPYKWG